jgi:ubiquinone/menaquinone biosynthesis C-methylase UbiE
MSVTNDPRRFFTERHELYARFIRSIPYSEAFRAFFVASRLLRPGMRVLEAGCGTGALTLAVHDASLRLGIPFASFDAFDLTPAMLQHLRATLEQRGIAGVTLAEANVLELDTLPATWNGYDLVVSAAMLEYVPRERFIEALRGLRARLKKGGHFVLFMTKRNVLTRLMVGYWWRSNLYSAAELSDAFARAGFSEITFPGFPLSARYLSIWGHVVEAQR